MIRSRSIPTVFCLVFLSLTAPSEGAQKKSNPTPDVPADLDPRIETLEPGVRLTLLAEHPQLVTPTGIDVDDQGRIWLVACHTHFRPDDYVGPEHDEVLVFSADGRSRSVFYSGTDATMQLKLGPGGWVYLAERDRILRIRDSDGDGVGDTEETLADLDTEADYPHNGLSGMAWHPAGDLVFSLGENYAKDWTLTARDGSQVSGRGEGGIFRCSADGAGMRRIARGFWNPFGLLVREDGEMFAAENDPGSRPPCRLLSIVEGGDYGFQLAYGGGPIHPFVAWNGELRGTLGMIHPSGEGPCAVVELGGGVMIPAWSHHRIDYFPLIRQGAGYTSRRIELLKGSDFFRPVCMAPGPDGAFYLTDWVFSSYQVHSRGRLWKLEIDRSAATWMLPAPQPMNAPALLARRMRDGTAELTISQLLEHAGGTDPYLSDAALTALARQIGVWTVADVRALSAQDRVWAIVALRRVDLNEEKWVREFLQDADREVQFECLRWIADAVLRGLLDDVEAMLTRSDLDYRLFEAALATVNTLRGKPDAGVTDPDVLAERIQSDSVPDRLKAYALRLAPANHERITIPLLRSLLASADPLLQQEVIRTLAARSAPDAWEVLAEVSSDEGRDLALRADAIAGLAVSNAPDHHALLLSLAQHENVRIRHEALRSVRGMAPFGESGAILARLAERWPESRPLAEAALDPSTINAGRPAFEQTEVWLERLAALPGVASPDDGRRIFFHPRLATCSKCHRHSGRGNVVGPDLSFIAAQSDQKALLRAILEPNRDVAPQYYMTLLELADGTTFSGILLSSASVHMFRDASGQQKIFSKADIVHRSEMSTSLMPAGTILQLTDTELRDLLAFLSRLGSP